MCKIYYTNGIILISILIFTLKLYAINNHPDNKITTTKGISIETSQEQLKQDFNDVKAITISWLKNSSLYKEQKGIDEFCKKISALKSFKYSKFSGNMSIEPYIFFNYKNNNVKCHYNSDTIILQLKRENDKLIFDFVSKITAKLKTRTVSILPIGIPPKQLQKDFSDIRKIIISWLKNSSLYKEQKEIDEFCKKISASSFKYSKESGVMLIHPYMLFNYRNKEIRCYYDNDMIILKLKRKKNKLVFDFLSGIIYDYKEKKETLNILFNSNRCESLKKLRQVVVEKLDGQRDFLKSPPSIIVSSYQHDPKTIYYVATIYFAPSSLKLGISSVEAKKMLLRKLKTYIESHSEARVP